MSSTPLLQKIKVSKTADELLPLLKELRNGDNSTLRTAETRDALIRVHPVVSNAETAYWYARCFSWFATPAEGQELCATQAVRDVIVQIAFHFRTAECSRMICIAVNNICCSERAKAHFAAKGVKDAFVVMKDIAGSSASVCDVYCRAVTQICGDDNAKSAFATPDFSEALDEIGRRLFNNPQAVSGIPKLDDSLSFWAETVCTVVDRSFNSPVVHENFASPRLWKTALDISHANKRPAFRERLRPVFEKSLLLAVHRSLENASAFLRLGLSPHMAGPKGGKLIHQAAASGHPDILLLLIREYKANILEVNDDGETPLHTACLSGNPQIVQVLLENGARDSLFAVTTKKETPREIANRCKSKGVVDVIDSFCAANKIQIDANGVPQKVGAVSSSFSSTSAAAAAATVLAKPVPDQRQISQQQNQQGALLNFGPSNQNNNNNNSLLSINPSNIQQLLNSHNNNNNTSTTAKTDFSDLFNRNNISNNNNNNTGSTNQGINIASFFSGITNNTINNNSNNAASSASLPSNNHSNRFNITATNNSNNNAHQNQTSNQAITMTNFYGSSGNDEVDETKLSEREIKASQELLGLSTGGAVAKAKELLEKKGANIHYRHTQTSKQAIHNCVGGGNIKILELLLSHGASLSAKTKEGLTARDLALKLGRRAVLGYIDQWMQDASKRFYWNSNNVANSAPSSSSLSSASPPANVSTGNPKLDMLLQPAPPVHAFSSLQNNNSQNNNAAINSISFWSNNNQNNNNNITTTSASNLAVETNSHGHNNNNNKNGLPTNHHHVAQQSHSASLPAHPSTSLQEENSKLKRDNYTLKAENLRLQEENNMLKAKFADIKKNFM